MTAAHWLPGGDSRRQRGGPGLRGRGQRGIVRQGQGHRQDGGLCGPGPSVTGGQAEPMGPSWRVWLLFWTPCGPFPTR